MSQRARRAAPKPQRTTLERITRIGSVATLSVTLVLASVNVYGQNSTSVNEVKTSSAPAAQTVPSNQHVTTHAKSSASASTSTKPRVKAKKSVSPVKPTKTNTVKRKTQFGKKATTAKKPRVATKKVTVSDKTKATTRKYLASRNHSSRVVASRMRSITALKGQIASLKSQLVKPRISGSKVLDIADNYRGVPYVRAGTSPRGFDCSGYTQYVFRQLGITLPRVAADQANHSLRVSRSQARSGDLIFFHSSNGYVYHVGIYAGNGKFWHSPRTGKTVRLDPVWAGKVVTFGRVATSQVQRALMNRVIQKTKALNVLLATK